MKKISFLSFLLLLQAQCSIMPSTNTIGIGREPDFFELPPKSDYVIYSDTVTLPTLYMGLNMQTHTKPSFIFMSRETIINFPSHVTRVKDRNELKVKIAELNKANPNSTFTFYVNEARIAEAIIYFYKQGIPESRVKIIQLSDGTLTYKRWSDEFSGTDSFSKWKNNETLLKNYVKNPNSVGDEDYSKFEVYDDAPYLTTPTSLSNVELWLQWSELLVSDSTDLQEYLGQSGSRYLKVDPLKYFQSLSTDRQLGFVRMIGLDKRWASGEGGGTLNNQTISEALDVSPKPNIIITGTNPYGANTDSLIAKAKAIYGDGYDYFFKGHPGNRTKPSDKSIVVLPFRLPMEAILWAYGSKISVLGGYESSLYMNADKSIEKFFFNEKSYKTLFPPLDRMYEKGLLGKVTFIN